MPTTLSLQDVVTVQACTTLSLDLSPRHCDCPGLYNSLSLSPRHCDCLGSLFPWRDHSQRLEGGGEWKRIRKGCSSYLLGVCYLCLPWWGHRQQQPMSMHLGSVEHSLMLIISRARIPVLLISPWVSRRYEDFPWIRPWWLYIKFASNTVQVFF